MTMAISNKKTFQQQVKSASSVPYKLSSDW